MLKKTWIKLSVILVIILLVVACFLVLRKAAINNKNKIIREEKATELALSKIPTIVPKKDSLEIANQIIWEKYLKKSKEKDSLLIESFALKLVIDSIQKKEGDAKQLATVLMSRPRASTSQRSSCPPPPPQVDPYTGYVGGQEQANEGW